MAGPPTALLGRDVETQQVRERVAHIGTAGGTVVVAGPPGIGKSALLATARQEAEAAGHRVLTSTAVQVEAHLPFAGLHQLLRPVLAGAANLPVRLREALLAAFGLGPTITPDAFLIALAALELLADGAAETPVVVLVDDAHWLDGPSASALAFVARRLTAEPIAVLVGMRTGYETPLATSGLRQLVLGPLDDVSASTLVDRHAPDLEPALRRRVLDEASGNPLALKELPTALRAERAGPAVVPLPTLTARLEQAFSARFAELDPASRMLVLVAAAHDSDVLSEILDAAARGAAAAPDATTAALDDVLVSGLLTVEHGRTAFVHPLMRSAIYHSAPSQDRVRAHQALAEALGQDPDRRAWHQAASALVPEEQVAGDLERAGWRAEGRGAVGTALLAFRRAAELTPAAAVRGTRLVRAAELAVQLGRVGEAADLAKEADVTVLGARDVGRLHLVREATEPGDPSNTDSLLALVARADAMVAQADVPLALRFLHAAAMRCFWADTGPVARQAVLDGAGRMPLPADDVRLLTVRALTDPRTYGPQIIDEASRLTQRGVDPDTAYQLSAVVGAAGAFDVSAGLLASAVKGLREQGKLGRLPEVLTTQAWTAISSVDWYVALPAAEEGARLAAETGQPLWEAGSETALGMLAALRGDADHARDLLAHAESLALPLHANAFLCGIQLTRGVLALSEGRYAEAYAQLRRMFDPGDTSYHRFQSFWAIGDLAEAALHSGHVTEGREVLAVAEAQDQASVSPWLRTGLLYGRPLLAEQERAEDLFRSAVDADLSRWPMYRARLLLEYGSWLRRRRRVVEARTPLRAALEAFDALGIVPWQRRARQELRAAGEAAPSTTPDVWARLSPQELQIARMVAQGLTNREIGEQLYLSHRTVGSHLYRIFPKLGITSRAQLRTLVDGGGR